MEEENGSPGNPPLKLADLRFLATCSECSQVERDSAREQLFLGIQEGNMAPFYELMCEELQTPVDNVLLKRMKETNEAELEKLVHACEDAEENLGQTEVRDALLAKAEYLASIGDKTRAETAFRVTQTKSSSVGQRLDIVFHLIRLGMFFQDGDMVARNLEKGESLLEEGGDWDRRNRLKAYAGVHALVLRKFDVAAQRFLEVVSTFTCTELMEYSDFVSLTVLSSMLALDRVTLQDKVIKGPEIQEVLHSQPMIKNFLEALYYSKYDMFFTGLAEVEGMMARHRLLAPHRRFYVREMRILAYQQLLQSYRSLTLESMAQSFGVSVAFIDTDISRFIAASRLNCKIDKVAGVVETNRPDKKNAQYQAVIKQGDLLLTRLQKLSQVINI